MPVVETNSTTEPKKVGILVGEREGAWLVGGVVTGEDEGLWVGFDVTGDCVGLSVGLAVGLDDVGLVEGDWVGICEGGKVGDLVGPQVPGLAQQAVLPAQRAALGVHPTGLRGSQQMPCVPQKAHCLL